MVCFWKDLNTTGNNPRVNMQNYNFRLEENPELSSTGNRLHKVFDLFVNDNGLSDLQLDEKIGSFEITPEGEIYFSYTPTCTAYLVYLIDTLPPQNGFRPLDFDETVTLYPGQSIIVKKEDEQRVYKLSTHSLAESLLEHYLGISLS